MSVEIQGKKVGPIGYGLMGLTTRPEGLSEEACFAAIKAALDSGCNYFNGGEFYGGPDNNSLTLLRRYYEKYPGDADRVLLNIKGCIVRDPAPNPDGKKETVVTSIENSLSWLGPRGRIDQFEPGRKDPKVDFEGETLATIDQFVEAGKIGAVSLSETNAATIRSAAKRFKIASVELELSLFCTEPLTDGTLATCAELGIPVLAYSPVGRGLLSGAVKSLDDLAPDDVRRLFPRFQSENFDKNLELVGKVNALAQSKGCTPAQIAINWILAVSKRPGMPTIVPIPGSTNPDRIRENATIIDLTDGDLKEIDEILKSFVPAGTRYPAPFMSHLQL